MATAAAKIVNRLEEAKETKHLDMTECNLRQVPVAIYIMLGDSPPNTCNFSKNKVKKVPVKFCNKFPAIQEFVMQENGLVGIPDEVGQLTELRVLDLSTNAVCSVPRCVYTLPSLQRLVLDNNNIQDVDVDAFTSMTSLQLLSLRNNPLNDEIITRLNECTRFTVEL